ncbi:hypothetical protein MHY1_02831 [Methylovirgula sp. HY1]|nr:hypothetical protein MHY1_02831 [Methylovirgula sp. HY1]
MRGQRVSWFTLLSGLLLVAGLAVRPAMADDQTIGQKPLAPLGTEAAPATAPVAPANVQPQSADKVKASTEDAAAADDPQVTESSPETDKMQSPPPFVPVPPAGGAVGTDRPSSPESGAAAPSSTPASPAATAPATPAQSGSTPKQAGTPAAASVPTPAAPTFADVLHKALDAYGARPIEGRDAAERRKLRADILAFYAARNYAPLWVEDGKPNAAAHSAMDRIAHAGDDGLSLRDMPAPVFVQAEGEPSDNALATAEIDLSARIVAYGRQASGSRLDPRRISALIGAKPEVAAPAQILASVAAAGTNAGPVLEAFNPPQAGYRALREKLAELRRETPPVADGKPIPRGPTLKVGMSDPRVPLIRARFGLDTEPPVASDDLLYDTRVAGAVAEFQKANGLPASGLLTARTIAALSGGQPSRLENELLANMEFWRWMPRDMGSDRVDVNIPDFTVRVIRDNHLIWQNKVIVGKPQTATPVFSNAIRYVIVNPYWNVPASIIRKEMLPHLERDPTYLSSRGFEVFTRHGRLAVRQLPGPRNALGRIKFIFPNDYSVYLHDTPTRGLFASKRRAYSHGCVRVNKPFGFAQALLGPASGWSESRVEHLVGSKQHYIYLQKPMPIHIEYFTAFVDADGRLQLRDDIYRYTHKVELALGLER